VKIFIEFRIRLISSLKSIFMGLVELRLFDEHFLYFNELFLNFFFLDLFLIVDNDFEQRGVLFWEILVPFLIEFH
jgi:hypothetical protein